MLLPILGEQRDSNGRPRRRRPHITSTFSPWSVDRLTLTRKEWRLSSTSALLHHFDSAEQQKEASSLGMWIFLVTEIMFFGGMFTAYIVYRSLHPAGFVEASHELNLTLGAINTAVLICSS